MEYGRCIGIGEGGEVRWDGIGWARACLGADLGDKQPAYLGKGRS